MTLHAQLAGFGRALRRIRLTRIFLRWLALTLALWLAWFWFDNLLRLPAGIRLAMLVVGLAVPAWRCWHDLLRPRHWRLTPERTARELERRCGITDNLLINACLFENAPLTGAPAVFAAAALESGAACSTAIRPEQLRDGRQLRHAVAAAGVCVVLWCGYALTLSHQAGNAWARLVRPLADIPPASDVAVTLTPGPAVTLWAGDSLVVTAQLQAVSGRVMTAPRAVPVLRRTQRSGLGAASVDLTMVAEARAPGRYVWSFDSVREPFACCVLYADTWSRTLTVQVRHPPRIVASSFVVTPPAYAGSEAETQAGAPAVLRALAGSRVRVAVALDRKMARVVWLQGSNQLECAWNAASGWWVDAPVGSGGDYLLQAAEKGDEPLRSIAGGGVLLQQDRTPEVEFATDSRNQLFWAGEAVAVPVEASDDYGMQAVWVTVAPAAAPADQAKVVAQWPYPGPPGRKGGLRERLSLTLDPALYLPGESYRLEARARDWNPGGTVAVSAPLVVRMRRTEEASQTLAGAAQTAARALEQAVVEQRRSLGMTRNLEVHVAEALARQHMAAHRKGIQGTQEAARNHGRSAVAALTNAASETSLAVRLSLLVEQEMGQALAQIGALEPPAATVQAALPGITRLAENQSYILNELLTLLGRLAAQARLQQERDPGQTAPPAPTDADRARDLQAFLKDFAAVQKRIVEQSRSLLERGPEDLTEAELDILGKLAREEGKWAAMLRDKLDDLSKNPLQDFADGSLAEEFNEIWQDVQKAAESLYAKKIELAVPQEQAGLENAEELIHNLERWMTDKPDYVKWLMEEPPNLPDVPLAELPRELEDIVGELLDEEEAMTEDVEDMTSGWIDSIDKGAGWDAMDGPISSMSAKGVTGNQLPNNQEIGGRSGEGRTGRSQGQMVENAAVGKDGRQTPSRLTPTPFETGAVDDQSKQSPGGATGGGKLAGFAEQGLRGPSPPPRKEQMQRLAGRQTEIRQNAERLNLHLRAHGVPSGDLDAAIANMRDFERQAQAGKGAEIRRAFDATLDAMRGASATVAAEAASRRERGALPQQEAEALWSGLRADVPLGYEEIVAAYYRRLAEMGGAREPEN